MEENIFVFNFDYLLQICKSVDEQKKCFEKKNHITTSITAGTVFEVVEEGIAMREGMSLQRGDQPPSLCKFMC